MHIWYYLNDGVKCGPFSADYIIDLIKSGPFEWSMLVSNKTMHDWAEAKDTALKQYAKYKFWEDTSFSLFGYSLLPLLCYAMYALPFGLYYTYSWLKNGKGSSTRIYEAISTVFGEESLSRVYNFIYDIDWIGIQKMLLWLLEASHIITLLIFTLLMTALFLLGACIAWGKARYILKDLPSML